MVFWKNQKTDKPLARLMKERIQNTDAQNKRIIKSWNKDITTDLTEIKMVTREGYEQLYISWLDNLDEMDKFL